MTYLEQVRARAEKASPGPWNEWATFLVLITAGQHERPEIEYKQDAAFIAHARTDIPELLRRLELAERALDCIDQPYLSLHVSPEMSPAKPSPRCGRGGE